MITAEELRALLAGGHELRRLEVKGAGLVRGNDRFVAKVARAVMAMGNLRDGGLVVVGVADDQIAAMQPGLSEAEVAEWSDFDLVSASLGKYSDPPVSFEISPIELSSGARVVVLDVAEFDRDVHVCKKDFQSVLQAGQTYVRPRGKPESVPVPSAGEARELHDLAIEKGVREFVRRAGAAGIHIGSGLAPGALDERAFAEEVGVGWAEPSSVTDPDSEALGAWVTKPGFTDVVVRPGSYSADRLSAGQLDRFVAEHAVSIRGWPVPFVDQREPVERHGSWIAQDIAPGVVPHGEAWRFFTSGQFLHRRLLVTDLSNGNGLAATVPDATGSVAIWDVLLYLVEVAEFGARMATALGLDQVVFEVALEGIAGRQLISGDWKRGLPGRYVASANRFEGDLCVGIPALLESPARVGVALTQRLVQQFGLDVPDELLFDWQDQVFSQRR